MLPTKARAGSNNHQRVELKVASSRLPRHQILRQLLAKGLAAPLASIAPIMVVPGKLCDPGATQSERITKTTGSKQCEPYLASTLFNRAGQCADSATKRTLHHNHAQANDTTKNGKGVKQVKETAGVTQGAWCDRDQNHNPGTGCQKQHQRSGRG